MDIPLVDKSMGDIEAQINPLDELKPLRWSAMEVRYYSFKKKIESNFDLSY